MKTSLTPERLATIRAEIAQCPYPANVLSGDPLHRGWSVAAELLAVLDTLARTAGQTENELTYVRNDVAAAGEAIAGRDRKIANLRASIEGSAAPPTTAELEAHHAADGWWVLTCHDGSVEFHRSNALATLCSYRGTGIVRRWRTLDKHGKPCERPGAPVLPPAPPSGSPAPSDPHAWRIVDAAREYVASLDEVARAARAGHAATDAFDPLEILQNKQWHHAAMSDHAAAERALILAVRESVLTPPT